MTIDQLRYFVGVAEAQSFTTAAKNNYITQPAISRHINDLEQTLNVRLFIRDTHSVKLTTAGQHFLAYAIEVLKLTREMETRLQNISDGNVGTIRISALTTMASLLAECLASFSGKYPNVQIYIDMLSGTEQKIAIMSHSYDFFFARKDMIEGIESLEYTNVATDNYCLVVNKNYETQIDASNFSTLPDKPMAFLNQLTSPAMCDDVLAICRKRNYTPKIMNYYNRAETAIISVSAGIAISILPISLVRLHPMDNVTAIPLSGEDIKLQLVVAWEKEPINLVAEKFAVIVKELYSNVVS